MKLFRIPSALLTMALATLLTACGGTDPQTDAQATTAALMQRVDVAANQSAPAHNPVPDCAPEGCNGLRIIDGNAEAFRIDAMRKASAEQNDPTPQS
jgi:hypothetical protein